MKPKKRILYIGNKLAKHGKSPTTADTLPLALEREGYSVTVASDKLSVFQRFLDMVLVTIRNRKKIDIVIIDTYSTWNFYYSVIIARICRFYKLPYIPILHGGNLPNRLKNSKILSQKLFKGAKTNVAPSIYLMELFDREGFQNITYIPNSIAIKDYPFLIRKSVKPKLLWVRSFAEIYNPLMALEIVEILKKRDIEVDLCMVGPEKDGALGRCREVAKQLGLPVTFTDLLTKEEWISLSSQYDIFLNTTNFDNMPVSVMEAMALGMPVISTDVGGMPFLIETNVNGILQPPNDAHAFAETILDLCQNPFKTKAISINARTTIERFDWQQLKISWINTIDF
ncbi:glycosyltransferase [Aequorivita sp. H23M31]|uniref:Glycosyltransferase n=1 Tax=Aequorivita ciconiae TaxID=2494375 RepID=A0A410G2K9_9FLAO|nr:glycosyltransferase family 4 protein [Aequorivita sp. H23M31]QAA81465.1 glycosyltransferase [Aequorivita sp. H23M31]